MKPVLDACCGSRMFWFDRHHPDVVFMDRRGKTVFLVFMKPSIFSIQAAASKKNEN